jgi:hypothetical protein
MEEITVLLRLRLGLSVEFRDVLLGSVVRRTQVQCEDVDRDAEDCHD